MKTNNDSTIDSYDFHHSEYCKYHRDSKKEYEDWLEKKAKKAKLKVEHIAEF